MDRVLGLLVGGELPLAENASLVTDPTPLLKQAGLETVLSWNVTRKSVGHKLKPKLSPRDRLRKAFGFIKEELRHFGGQAKKDRLLNKLKALGLEEPEPDFDRYTCVPEGSSGYSSGASTQYSSRVTDIVGSEIPEVEDSNVLPDEPELNMIGSSHDQEETSTESKIGRYAMTENQLVEASSFRPLQVEPCHPALTLQDLGHEGTVPEPRVKEEIVKVFGSQIFDGWRIESTVRARGLISSTIRLSSKPCNLFLMGTRPQIVRGAFCQPVLALSHYGTFGASLLKEIQDSALEQIETAAQLDTESVLGSCQVQMCSESDEYKSAETNLEFPLPVEDLHSSSGLNLEELHGAQPLPLNSLKFNPFRRTKTSSDKRLPCYRGKLTSTLSPEVLNWHITTTNTKTFMQRHGARINAVPSKVVVRNHDKLRSHSLNIPSYKRQNFQRQLKFIDHEFGVRKHHAQTRLESIFSPSGNCDISSGTNVRDTKYSDL